MAFGFEPYHYDKFHIDYSHCTPVSVIANFRADGKIMPVYICVTDLYGNILKTRIEGIKYTKDNDVCSTYCCSVTNGRRQQEILLTYYFERHLWVLENKN